MGESYYDDYSFLDIYLQEESEMDSTPGNVIAVLICIFGLIGNLMSIFVIIVLKEYKKTTLHLYVLQLAIADAIFLATIPFKVHQDNVKVWNFGVAACKAKETITYLNYYASIFFLMVMSCDRYIAVCHSFSPMLRKLRTTFSAWIVIVAIWILSFLVCIPVIMYVQVAGEKGSVEEGYGCKCSYVFPRKDDMNYSSKEFCKDPFSFSGFDDSGSTEESGSTEYEMTTTGFISDQATGRYYGNDGIGTAYDDDGDDGGLTATLATNITNNNITSYILSDYEDNDVISSSCHYINEAGTGWYSFIYINFAILFVLPVVVMLVTYGFIIDKMRKSEARTGTTRSSSRAETIRSTGSAQGANLMTKKKKPRRTMTGNRRITIMCTSLVGSFIALWLPFHAIHLAKIDGINYPPKQGHICKHLTNMGTILGYLNSALNPYLYSFLGTNFMRRFKSARSTIRQSIHSSETGGRTRAKFTRGKGSESGGYNVTLETRAFGGGKLVDSGSSKGGNTIVANPKSEQDQKL